MSQPTENLERGLRQARAVFGLLVALGLAMVILGFVGSMIAFLCVDEDDMELIYDTYFDALSANPQARQGVCIFVAGVTVLLTAGYGLWVTGTPTSNRRFRFSLSAYFKVLTIAAVGLGWLAYHLSWIRHRHEAREWIAAHGQGGFIVVSLDERPELPWSLWVLGEKSEGFLPVDHNASEDLAEFQAKAEEMQRLFPESQVTDLSKPRDPASHP